MPQTSEGVPKSSVVCKPAAPNPFWRDRTFQALLAHQPRLRDVTRYFPANETQPVFSGQERLSQLWSSYKEHGYGYLFYALTRLLRPTQCVELGVLQGFSLLTVASALRDNGAGRVNGFDLFETYPYHHEHYAALVERIKECGLTRWASAERLDAFEASQRFDTVDVLHVDISNNGETYRTIFEQWATKVTALMILEGGSADRDRVEWMVKYQKPSITKALEEIRSRYPAWDLVVLEPYPSVTVAVRRGGANSSQLRP